MIHVDIFSWLWMILAYHHDDDQYLESWQWWWWWSTPRVVSWQWWHTGRGHLHRLFLPSSLLARDAIQNSGFASTAKVIFFPPQKVLLLGGSLNLYCPFYEWSRRGWCFNLEIGQRTDLFITHRFKLIWTLRYCPAQSTLSMTKGSHPSKKKTRFFVKFFHKRGGGISCFSFFSNAFLAILRHKTCFTIGGGDIWSIWPLKVGFILWRRKRQSKVIFFFRLKNAWKNKEIKTS